MFRLIQQFKPSWVIGENVSGHIKLGLDTVLENLESEGYTARTFSISASSVGANHKRERVWILAYSERNGLLTTEKQRSFEKTISNQSKGENDTFNVERTSSVSETKSDVENSRRSSGREQSSGDKESFGLWSFETSEWSTDTNQITGSSERAKTMADTDRGEETLGWWDIEPDVGRVAHGIPKRVDRLKCLGNSVVPQIPFLIGLAIKETIENE
jgi:DNA (cytosine-5)-methyltransferase 1